MLTPEKQLGSIGEQVSGWECRESCLGTERPYVEHGEAAWLMKWGEGGGHADPIANQYVARTRCPLRLVMKKQGPLIYCNKALRGQGGGAALKGYRCAIRAPRGAGAEIPAA